MKSPRQCWISTQTQTQDQNIFRALTEKRAVALIEPFLHVRGVCGLQTRCVCARRASDERAFSS